ncbi:hypothetical protein Tco_0369394 [Tanacetum coccineum]
MLDVDQCLDQEDIHNGDHGFLRYIDTKKKKKTPNGEGLRKSILSGPYVPSTVLVQAVAATEGNPAIQQHTTIETVLNMTPENKEHFLSEKEAIFLLLTGIGDDIYSTVDASVIKEVKICAERIALLAAAQPYSDNYYQAPKPQRTNTTSSSTRPSASTRHKGKEIAKPVTPQSESLSLREALQKSPYSTTTFEILQTLRTRSEDTIQRLSGVATEWDTVFNARDFGNYAKEGRDAKRVERLNVHKEKMMMCKQAKTRCSWQNSGGFTRRIGSNEQPLEQVHNNDENTGFANERQHSENNTAECADERVALANLIANLTLDTEENKMILKQLKKANASLTQELEECKTNLDETSRALGEATSCRDSCLIALQNKQNELEKYIAFNDRTIDYDILQTKLNETLGLLARKDIDIKEGLKTKAYEISVVNQKHDELVKRSLLTKSQFEGQLKEKSKVILDLKVKEEKDIDKMIDMDKQLKFLNEIVYTRNQSIQTIHMLAPKCSTYNGRPTFANPRYLKKAQSEKPCLYEIPYDNSDLANRFAPDREENMTLAN